MEEVLGLLAVDLGLAQVDEHQVHVGATGEDVDAGGLRVVLREPVRQRLRATERALLAVLELGRRREQERGGLGGDHVHERAALLAREHGGVQLLEERLLVGQDDARTRTGERLVHRRRHHVGVRQRRRVQARGDEPGEVRHVDPERGTDLVGDLAELREVELARVRRPAGDEDLRLVLDRLRADVVVVDLEGLRVDAVRHGVVDAAGEVELHAVGQVAAVGELETEDGVAGGGDGVQDGGVRAGAGVRLHVRVRSAEEGLRAVDGELLGDVDELAAAVVALARVALGVLVRQDGALRLEDGARHEVLGRDHLEGVALATELVLQDRGDLGIDLGEGGVEAGRHGVRGLRGRSGQIGDGHGTPRCLIAARTRRGGRVGTAQAFGMDTAQAYGSAPCQVSLPDGDPSNASRDPSIVPSVPVRVTLGA
ncbi:molybdenum cofactor biosynthesis enzyme [Curtobacterium sp. ER1/6]|nr:molybdenum cofactor biosynthesis enzyme [Curtobacterium sp. ER1/6]